MKRILSLALLGALVAGPAFAQGRPYYSYPAAAPLTGAEIVGPIRQGTSDRTTTIGGITALVAGDTGIVVPDTFKQTTDGGDDALAINRAVAAVCAKGGGKVTFLARTYELLTGISNTACPVTFQGAGWNEVASGGGTWLHTARTTASMLSLSTAAARGSEILDIGFAQTQPSEVSGWTPTVYPPAINISGTAGRVSVRRVMFGPVYDGISAVGAGRLELDDIYGQPLHRGVVLDQSYDTVHTSTIHFWPFWANSLNIARWIQQNGDAVLLQRVDGFVAPDLFVYGYHSALRIDQSSSGIPSKFDIGSLYADSCKYGIWIIGGDNATGLIPTGHVASMWSQGELAVDGGAGTPAAGAVGVFSDVASHFELTVGSLSVERVESYAVYVGNATDSVSSKLTLGALRVDHFNSLGDNSPAIYITPITGTPHRVVLATDPILTNGGVDPQLLNATTADFRAPNPKTAIQPVASSGSYAIGNSAPRILLSSAGGQTVIPGLITLTLPNNPFDGKVQEIGTLNAINSLTIAPGIGQSIVGVAPTSLPASSNLRFQYVYSLAAWVRLN